MPSSRRPLLALALLALASAGQTARAAYQALDLSPFANQNIRQSPYQTAAALPAGGTTIAVGDVPFTLATLGGQAGTTGVVQVGTFDLGRAAPTVVDIAVNVAGAVRVATLINSTYGTLNRLSGRVEFFGSGGAFASFDLVQGVNIRDYNVGSVFNNAIAPGTATATFTTGGRTTRLDRQVFDLPTAFAAQTLTTIRLVNSSTDLFVGAPFLAAASVSVPEPGSATLVGVAAAVGLIGHLRRRRRAVGR